MFKNSRTYIWVILFLTFALHSNAIISDSSLVIWYDQPAERWLESLPLGNGRVGAMVFGGISKEKIALNETSFWSGAASDRHDNHEAKDAFIEIRKLFKEGKHEEAHPLVRKMFGRRWNYGTSLPAGDLLINQDIGNKAIKDYRRELNLENSIATVSYKSGKTHYKREYISSHPDNVLAIRLTSDERKNISFTLKYKSEKLPHKSFIDANNRLIVEGNAFEEKHSNGKTGVSYHIACEIYPSGGELTHGDSVLKVSNADTVLILVALNTNYQKRDPARLSHSQIKSAGAKSWQELLRQHTEDYHQLFNRVSLNLGANGFNDIPTDIRLKQLEKYEKDPFLSALFFHFGRYLMISGSRHDSPLPMHLQGIWNDGLAASIGWTCDYHLDINTQQSYWPADVTNLDECSEPLFRLIESLQIPGNRTARNTYGIEKGWVCHVFTNAWGYTAPGGAYNWGMHVTGGIWIASHLWEHYLYTEDKKFLAETAWPILKGAAEFFLEYLYTDPRTGYLVSGPSVSPEIGGEVFPGGPVHDRALIYNLFSCCIMASNLLGRDPDFGQYDDIQLRHRLEEAITQLPPYKIGFNGQLMEWLGRDIGGMTNHRHTSHLVGLFPLDQITPQKTPELALAARKSLEIRMDRPDWEDVEWSSGNSICYYARLGDGEQAHKNLINQLVSNTDANLFTFHSAGIAGAHDNVFSIDGNFSTTAGIAEMLMQSHHNEIKLLPALPKAWPNGSVKGLRARGGMTIDMTWRNYEVVHYEIFSSEPREVKVNVNDQNLEITTKIKMD